MITTIDPGQQLDPIHSICQGCIFAQYDDGPQAGCDAGRVEKYREQGNLIEAFDDGGEFFIVNGRLCSMRRTPEQSRGNSVAERLCNARAEIRLGVDVIVVADSDLDALGVTLDALGRQTLPPAMVVCVNNGALARGGLSAYLRGHTLTFNWKAQEIIERTPEGDPVPFGRVVDIALPQCSGAQYYTVLKAGCVPPLSYLEALDVVANDELRPPCVVKPNTSGNGLTALTSLHRILGGHGLVDFKNGHDGPPESELEAAVMNLPYGMADLAEKIEFLADATGRPELVQTAEAMWPTLS